MNNKIAVIGAAGFIGKTFVNHARSFGHDIIPISRYDVDLLTSTSNDKLLSLIKHCNCMLVLSALTPKKGLSKLQYNMRFMDNLRIIENILKVVLKSSITSILYVSSDSVYSENINNLDEDAPTDPNNFYGLAHRVREKMFLNISDYCQVCIIRPCALFGASDPHNGYGPNRFMREALLHHKITIFGNGEEQRNHIWVADFTKIMLHFIQNQIVGIFNIAQSPPITFYALAKLINKILPFNIEMKYVERVIPIQHRIHNIDKFLKLDIDVPFTKLENSLKIMYKEIKRQLLNKGDLFI